MLALISETVSQQNQLTKNEITRIKAKKGNSMYLCFTVTETFVTHLKSSEIRSVLAKASSISNGNGGRDFDFFPNFTKLEARSKRLFWEVKRSIAIDSKLLKSISADKKRLENPVYRSIIYYTLMSIAVTRTDFVTQ